MLISEMIAALDEILKAHGDLICVDSYDEQIGYPELQDEVVVICDKA